ncbi:hypothetical protein FBU30_002290 [Linnemannia zychae]|nr:hypothetical protein FBU30_002290 [Linnemannia zychae]
MGVPGLWPLIREEGYEAALQRFPTATPDTHFHIDILGSFFSIIRRCFISSDIAIACIKFEKHLASLRFPKASTTLHLDGPSPTVKDATNRERQAKRRQAFTKADTLLTKMEDAIHNQHGKLRKRDFKTLNKAITNSFYFTRDLRQALTKHLCANGWNVCFCSFEADTCIGKKCGKDDVVVTRDSDSLIYNSISTIWRPTKGGYLVYSVPQVLLKIQLSRSGLTALGIVSQNDYGKGIHNLGLKTNFKIMCQLDAEGKVKELICDYLKHTTVSKKQIAGKVEWSIDSYADAYEVFVNMHQQVANHQLHATETIDSATPLLSNLQLRKRQVLVLNAKRKQVAYNERKARRAAQSVSDIQSKPINPFLAINKPNPNQPHIHRPRYTPKVRYEPINKQEPPPVYVQHSWKPWKQRPSLEEVKGSSSKKPPAPIRPMLEEDVIPGRKDIKAALNWEHPIVTLRLGLLTKNVHAVLKDQNMANSVPSPETPRPKAPVTAISSEDLNCLDWLCSRLPSKEAIELDEDNVGLDDGSNDDKNTPFLQCFLTYLYSDNLPSSKSKAGEAANKFIFRLQQLNILTALTAPSVEKTRNVREYTPSMLIRSVASQLGAELKRHYRHGCVQISEKGHIPSNQADIEPHARGPAIMVFVHLNAIAGYPWSVVPLSSAENGFMTFTESELGAFFHKREGLHPELKSLVQFSDSGRRLTQADIISDWCPLQAPGVLIKHFVAPVDPRSVDGQRLRGRKRKKAGIAAAVKLLSPSEIHSHINMLRSDDFDPRQYTEKGYVLYGSIKTDGHQLQVSAYKLRELNSVKYKRYSSERLPDRRLTTIAGTGDYLTEVRNVFKTKEDVEQLLGCTSDMAHIISYLGIDPGQACVVGAYASLPSDKEPRICRRRNKRKRKNNRRGTRGRKSRGNRTRKPREIEGRHINLAAKQKSVAQPTLRHRKWMENRKDTFLIKPEGQNTQPMSVSEIESSLPSFHGQEANLTDYLNLRNNCQNALNLFYNDRKFTFKKHKWLMKEAREEEFKRLTDGLLRMVGGTIGERRKPEDKVVIGIGLGDFKSTNRLSSLHKTFTGFFINKARALGYLVVGVCEYYTSKKCPTCEEFIGQAGDIRRFYCKTCGKYIHRDIAAAQNMCNILRSHVENQERPNYLHPVDEFGNFPWKEKDDKRTAKGKRNIEGANEMKRGRKRPKGDLGL